MKQKQQIIVLVVLVVVAALVWGLEMHNRTPNAVTTSFIQELHALGGGQPANSLGRTQACAGNRIQEQRPQPLQHDCASFAGGSEKGRMTPS